MASPADRERRQIAERKANAEAAARGEALPYPNFWDALDPTKVESSATQQQRLESVREFRRICRPRARKQHTI